MQCKYTLRFDAGSPSLSRSRTSFGNGETLEEERIAHTEYKKAIYVLSQRSLAKERPSYSRVVDLWEEWKESSSSWFTREEYEIEVDERRELPSAICSENGPFDVTHRQNFWRSAKGIDGWLADTLEKNSQTSWSGENLAGANLPRLCFASFRFN